MKKYLLIFTSLFFITNVNAYERKQIKVVGSSTVYPFVTVAAEEFGMRTGMPVPIIEATGTGGGMKLFCGGIGKKYPDISNASRAIKNSEIELCAKNGIDKITEIKMGYDGIVLSNSVESERFSLSTKELFLALAEKIPNKGKLIQNPYETWNEINPNLPKTKIAIYGPPPTSGTRDAFVEIIMQKTCVKMEEFKTAYPNKKNRKKHCSLIREDGHFLEAGENDNLIIQKLTSNRNSLGIFGFSFLEQNLDKVQGSIIDGYKPTFDNIADGKYPISRPLFVYIKNAHAEVVNGLKKFAEELVSDDAIGKDGYLTFRGLIPLRVEEKEKFVKAVEEI